MANITVEEVSDKTNALVWTTNDGKVTIKRNYRNSTSDEKVEEIKVNLTKHIILYDMDLMSLEDLESKMHSYSATVHVSETEPETEIDEDVEIPATVMPQDTPVSGGTMPDVVAVPTDSGLKILKKDGLAKYLVSADYADKYIQRELPGGKKDFDTLDHIYNEAKDRDWDGDEHYPLISGPTGSGKTMLLKAWAAKNQIPFYAIPCYTGIQADDLLGCIILYNKETYWVDGILTQFVREGGFIVMDEVNAADPNTFFQMHSLLDNRRSLTLGHKDGEVVKAHPNFWLAGTMNPNYADTQEMNEAFKGRLQPWTNWESNPDIEKKLIKNKAIIEIAKELRSQPDEIKTEISTRMLMKFAKNISDKEIPNEMAIYWFIGSFDEDEAPAVQNICELKFAQV